MLTCAGIQQYSTYTLLKAVLSRFERDKIIAHPFSNDLTNVPLLFFNISDHHTHMSIALYRYLNTGSFLVVVISCLCFQDVDMGDIAIA